MVELGKLPAEDDTPNVLLEQDNIESIVEVDLRLAIDGGLDQLVKTAVDASSNQAPSTDPLPTSVRKAMTTIQAAGYNPDTLLLTPAAAETLDTLVSGISGATADHVFGPGNPAGQLFGLQARVSKVIAAPVVVDSRAFGKVYVSPATLARFEVDADEPKQCPLGARRRLRHRAPERGRANRGLISGRPQTIPSDASGVAQRMG